MNRRDFLTGLVVFAAIPLSARAQTRPGMADDITLFDSSGDPAAYISMADELTIYLWGGQPVAYLLSDQRAFAIYGFNGKHLGWFEKGIVRDHDGDAVGFARGAVSMVTSLEPLKPLKQLKPLKSLRELAPLKPSYSSTFSATPLAVFLAAGV